MALAVCDKSVSAPLGMSVSDAETATVSRERRRVVIAAREAVTALKDDLDAKFAKLEESQNAGIGKIYDQLVFLSGQVRELQGQSSMPHMETTIDRLELPLFQTALPDFEKLDKSIASLSGRSGLPLHTTHEDDLEPEQERTPQKLSGEKMHEMGVVSNHEENAPSHTGRCLDEFYDIVVEDVGVQTSPELHTTSAFIWGSAMHNVKFGHLARCLAAPLLLTGTSLSCLVRRRYQRRPSERSQLHMERNRIR